MQWISVKDKPIPYDIPVLVYLKKESLGRRVHSAIFKKNVSLIGHHFAFDVGEMTHWMFLPDDPYEEMIKE